METQIRNYRNLIFDMGNVLIRFDPELFLEREGIKDDATREILLRTIFLSAGWRRLDEGKWNEEDLEAAVVDQLPKELRSVAFRLIHHWEEPMIPIDGMAQLLEKCKKAGYRLYLLSNASRRQHQYWHKIPGHEFFDGTLISADVLLVKPDPRIYMHLLEKYSLFPEESLFVDDMICNTEAAKKLGISSFEFHGNTGDLETFLFS